MKRKRCGSCDGCRRPDCGVCVLCKDKPKFGGPGKRKQCCELRKCHLISQGFSIQSAAKSAPGTSCNDTIDSYLLKSGRKIHNIKGDGNCLFRTISYALLNTEDHHHFIRSSIVRLINLNDGVFSQFLMPVINQLSISEQVRHMMRPHVWGTHLEIKAAATLFQLPIYFCTTSTRGSYSWNIFQPISPDHISFPIFPEEELQELPEREKITHIEMYHLRNLHYDVIASVDTGKICETPPHLTGRDDPETIDLS